MSSGYLDEYDTLGWGEAEMSDGKETQINCPKCPMYRSGSRPYCAKTGMPVRPDESLPLICQNSLKITPI